MEINGMAAIVTGGASGLGAATVAMLTDNGAKVAIFDHSKDEGLATAAKYSCKFYKVDVTRDADVEAGLAAAEASQGIASILVNCAGIAPAIKVVASNGEPHSVEEFRRVIEINLLGSFTVLAKFAARLMADTQMRDERGVIVNTASIAAYDGQIGQAAYSASKGGLVSMTLPIARELARSRIRVMTIAPGIFQTPILASLSEAVQGTIGQHSLHPSRMGRPDEFAHLVQSIIRNPMLNGETIRIDGAVRLPAR